MVVLVHRVPCLKWNIAKVWGSLQLFLTFEKYLHLSWDLAYAIINVEIVMNSSNLTYDSHPLSPLVLVVINSCEYGDASDWLLSLFRYSEMLSPLDEALASSEMTSEQTALFISCRNVLVIIRHIRRCEIFNIDLINMLTVNVCS